MFALRGGGVLSFMGVGIHEELNVMDITMEFRDHRYDSENKQDTSYSNVLFNHTNWLTLNLNMYTIVITEIRIHGK